MAVTRAQQAQLYTPVYDEFMLSAFALDKQVNPVIYKHIDDPTKEYKVDDISGLGAWVDANESEGGGYEDPVLGYNKTYTQAKYWKKFQCSFESVDQDEYALMKKEGEARVIGRGARVKLEQLTSAVLYDGFSNTGPDSQYLLNQRSSTYGVN